MKSSTRSTSSPLASLQLFQGLDDAQLVQALAASYERRYQKDEFIFQQEDPAQVAYVLKQGQVRLLQVTPEGQQVIMHYVALWQEFGLVAVLSNATYPVTAQAVSDCTVLSWEHSRLLELMTRYPQVAINAIRVLAMYIEQFQDKLREMATERVERRIAHTLLRLAKQAGKKTSEGVLIDLPLSRQDLAEMTGTTLFTVSRVLSQWDEQGLVQSGRERVVIRFPHGLVRIAEDLPESSEDNL